MPYKPNGLSCCEYINRKGEVAHILGCCCDCDVIDVACDRCIRCENHSENHSENTCRNIMSVLADRLRIPWLGGTGAIQIQFEAVSPIIIIPTLLVLSITHQYVAYSISGITPIILICYYKHWRNNPKRTRTRFFFYWALVSIFTMGYVFIGVCCYREIQLYEGMIVLGLFLLMLYTMYLTKQDAGTLRTANYGDVPNSRTFTAMPKKSHIDNLLHASHHTVPMSVLVNEKLDMTFNKTHRKSNSFSVFSAQDSQTHPEGIKDSGRSQIISSSSSVKEEMKLLCEKCQIKLPPRAGHCDVCHECFSVRDHHCIWLDTCVGLKNHRAFMLTIILFLMVSVYGLHLSLTTICTPIMVMDLFLLPNDCRFVYADLMGAIAYVSCIYTGVSVILVTVLFVQQLILISQNITMQEFNLAVKKRQDTNRTSWLKSLYISDNGYNQGFRTNWVRFFRRNRHEPTKPISETVL